MVRQIGMALEMPFEVLTMHFQSSYSAARAALLMAWKSFRSKRDLLAKQFCQPVFELWLADEVAEGRISAPGFFADDVVRGAWCAAIWTGDGPGSIDPSKEVDAAQKRVDLGISTKQAESILHDGVDWQQKHEQRVKEINAEKRDGIYIPPPGSPLVQPSAPNDSATSTAQTAAPAQAVVSFDMRTPDLTDAAQAIRDMTTATLSQIREDIQNMPIVIPAPNVTFEAIMPTMPAPAVHVHNTVQPAAVVVPPAAIVVQSGKQQSMRQIHKRDDDGNLIETITVPFDVLA